MTRLRYKISMWLLSAWLIVLPDGLVKRALADYMLAAMRDLTELGKAGHDQ